MTDTASAPNSALPRWSVADVHESFDSRTFKAALESFSADVSRLEAVFDESNVRKVDRPIAPSDGKIADDVISHFNRVVDAGEVLGAYIYATVSTDSRDESAQGLLSEIEVLDARTSPLLARLAEWVKSLGVDELAALSTEAA